MNHMLSLFRQLDEVYHTGSLATYRHTSSLMHTLCDRIEHFLPELFVLVTWPELPAYNILVQRSVRLLVIARKISGDHSAVRAPACAWVSLALWHVGCSRSQPFLAVLD